MIDFFKAYLTGLNQSDILEHPLLNFSSEMNPKTGEAKSRRNRDSATLIADYKNLKFEIFDSGTITLEGSLHKFWNQGCHNYNDFDLISILESLDEIQDTFNIHPEQMVLRRLEIGINFVPPYPTRKILENLFLHKKSRFFLKEWSKIGMYYQSNHTQYRIKAYDKAGQYRNKGYYIEDHELMRFETQFTKMERLKRALEISKDEVLSMKTLINKGKSNFVKSLTSDWLDVLMYDPTIKSNSVKVSNYSNPNYWNSQSDKRAFYKHRNCLNEMIKTSSENIKEQIRETIQTKGDFLMNKGIRIG